MAIEYFSKLTTQNKESILFKVLEVFKFMPYLADQVSLIYWGESVVLALALSVDATCASAINATDERIKKKRILFIFVCALVFATFHFVMPVIGYSFGYLFVDKIEKYTKWISFAILVLIGLKGLIEQAMEIHMERMERLAKSVDFDGHQYIRKMVAEGKNLRTIKKEYAQLGRRLKKDEAHGIAELEYEDHAKCRALGVYLVHESRCLNKKMLEEIVNPEAINKEESKKILSFVGALLLQALATSIDALAIGFSYADKEMGIALATFGIFFAGVFSMSLLGGFLGKLFGEKYQRIANILGSLVLVILGILALF